MQIPTYRRFLRRMEADESHPQIGTPLSHSATPDSLTYGLVSAWLPEVDVLESAPC
jgi:hypothetical protein